MKHRRREAETSVSCGGFCDFAERGQALPRSDVVSLISSLQTRTRLLPATRLGAAQFQPFANYGGGAAIR